MFAFVWPYQNAFGMLFHCRPVVFEVLEARFEVCVFQKVLPSFLVMFAHICDFKAPTKTQQSPGILFGPSGSLS